MTKQIDDPQENNVSPDRKGANGKLDHLYRNWFMDYASYVILDRAIPSLDDGLKPVQRRLLHALYELDDGRFNKAANVIGHTMRYHPHGDMAISDALVKLAQKDLLIETQGNWGNVATGDRAAASRYIEARLSPFGKEILFNAETTKWQASYDGRNKEPIQLPVKFPLLLALGAEGIAVGLATKILPHNFCELLRESIAAIKGHKPQIFPDFPMGGIADFSSYKDGKRGGKVKVRAVIDVKDHKTLCINEIPFGTTTTNLIESIIAAHDKGQIKVKKVEDNTASKIEILIHLPTGSSPEKVIQALYAFTNCEVSISPNCCIIRDGKPSFSGVSEIIKETAWNTQALLKKELEISKEKLEVKIHQAILEQIFISEKIYRKIETCTTWDEVLKKISKSLVPFSKKLHRPITSEDIERLTEIKIKRISKFDCEQSDKALEVLHEKLATVEDNLLNLNKFTISYFKDLLKKYGKGKERKTKIESFLTIKASAVVVADQKLYVNEKEGFAGTSLKKDTLVCECSKLDEFIAFCKDGTYKVCKISAKTFIGKNIIWIGLFKKGDERKIYHFIYKDTSSGESFVKRINITSATKDKVYSIAKAKKEIQILHFSVNPNGESEKIRINFRANTPIKKKEHLFNFASIPIKTRTAAGTKLTQYPILKITQEGKGASTLAAQRLWFDRALGTLNNDGNGQYLGKFDGEDKLIALYQSGTFEIMPCDLEHQFTDDLIEVQKLETDTIISAIYLDGSREEVYVKRVAVQDDQNGCKDYIPRTPGSKVLLATLKAQPVVKAEFDRKKNNKAPATQIIKLDEFIDVKSIKALGNKLSPLPLKAVKMLRD